MIFDGGGLLCQEINVAVVTSVGAGTTTTNNNNYYYNNNNNNNNNNNDTTNDKVNDTVKWKFARLLGSLDQKICHLIICKLDVFEGSCCHLDIHTNNDATNNNAYSKIILRKISTTTITTRQY